MRQRKSMFEVATLLDDTIEKGVKIERLASMSLADLVLEHRRVIKSLCSPTNRIRTEALLSAKGRLEHLIRKSRSESDLFKSISFNPLEPHAMNAESSYYNPYRQLADGSYAPHPTEHWMQQEPSIFLDGEFGGRRIGVGSAYSEAQRRDGYSEVDRFYRAAGVFKSELYASVDDLVKAIPTGPKGPGGKKGLPVGTVHTWNGMQFRKEADGQWLPVPQAGKGPHPIEQDASARHGKIQQILEARKKGKAQEPSFDDRARVATAKHKEISAKEGDLERRDRDAASRDHAHREKALAEKESQFKEQQKALEEHSKKLEEHGKKAPLEHQYVSAEAQQALKKKVARRPAGHGQHVELTKAELAHTLAHGRFSLISAGKNPNHEEDSKLADEDVKKRNDELEKELKESGYAYTRVKGHYNGAEDSFLVMVHEADKNHMTQLGKKLNQDSIIYADGGKQEMIYTTGDKAGRHHKGEGFVEKPDAEDYYSEMKTADGGIVKFSLDFDFDNLHGDQTENKAPGDGDKPHNRLSPPPSENRKFTKPGAKLSHAEVDEFIKKFEPDFKSLTSMADDLKQSGASHFSSRMKDTNSLYTKMKGRLSNRSLNTVSDVIGARALANSLDDQKSLLDKVRENYNVVELEDSSDKPRSDGYRAIHVLFRTPSGKLGELQLKTHRQQAFSGFTHDVIYKGPPEIKNDPEVKKYSMDLSNYLHGLDKGEKDDPKKRPKEPKSLRDKKIEFPWSDLESGLFKGEKGKLKHYVVVRDKDKKTLDIHEHDNFIDAKKKRDGLRAKGENTDGEHVIAYAHSKEEMLKVFSEYRNSEHKTGPGSRGGVVVGHTKTGKVKYQDKGGKK
jgi:ppGpp synthetase/RelA/SpoT-type nucleotidyltranferase